jgi:hypothetical protein
MKKLSAIAILSVAALVLSQAQASAWWNHFCCNHCCNMKICCKQYNAFSPFCCDMAQGCVPLGGYAGYGACGAGCAASAYPEGSVGQLPNAAELSGQPMMMGQAGMPGMPGGMFMAPGNNFSMAPQGWQPWGPGMMAPTGVPANYPMFGAPMPASAGQR